jgi:hypothetical protein
MYYPAHNVIHKFVILFRLEQCLSSRRNPTAFTLYSPELIENLPFRTALSIKQPPVLFWT